MATLRTEHDNRRQSGQDRRSRPRLRGQRVHYSRVIRFEGIRLPFNQRMVENLWGLSVLERAYVYWPVKLPPA